MPTDHPDDPSAPPQRAPPSRSRWLEIALLISAAVCLAIGRGFRLPKEVTRRVIDRLGTDVPRVRAAAARALILRQTNETEVLPALVARLDDEQVAVRRLAIDALGLRGSNALAAVPALQAAWENEPKRPRRTDPLDDLYRGGRALSANEVCWAIRWAIGQIDPQATLP